MEITIHTPKCQSIAQPLIYSHPKFSERKREIEKKELDSKRAERVRECEGLRERAERDDRVKEERREKVNKIY